MKETLLELVQGALSVMDSDRIDSLTDTEEAIQLSDLARDVYYELINRDEFPAFTKTARLTGAADTAAPTKFTTPDTITDVQVFKYNVADTGADSEFRTLRYCSLAEFLERYSSGSGSNRQEVVLSNGATFWVRTDRDPSIFTVIGDNEVYCDSFDSSKETTLQTSKNFIVAQVIPAFTVADAFVPDLPVDYFPWFKAEFRAQAFEHFKQQVSGPDRRAANRQLAQIRRKESIHDKQAGTQNGYFNTNFGRRGRGGFTRVRKPR